MTLRSLVRRGYATPSSMKATSQLGMATMFLVLGTSPTFAANLSICPSGCPFSTIQGAVDVAAPGDTLLIGKGHYFENVVIASKRITLQGAGRRITVIDGNDKGTVITVGDPNGAPRTIVALSDLTITRGSAPSGGGILVAPGGIARAASQYRFWKSRQGARLRSPLTMCT